MTSLRKQAYLDYSPQGYASPHFEQLQPDMEPYSCCEDQTCELIGFLIWAGVADLFKRFCRNRSASYLL